MSVVESGRFMLATAYLVMHARLLGNESRSAGL
jgi:hypothetical protein